jgi:5-methylcytosine-specific restriction endonuclease McrA
MSSPYYQTPHWRALRLQCLERDQHTCVVPGCNRRGNIADHIVARPDKPHPTPHDVLSNLRTLCRDHDNQVKERKGRYARKGDGKFRLRGCTLDGWPVDTGGRV